MNNLDQLRKTYRECAKSTGLPMGEFTKLVEAKIVEAGDERTPETLVIHARYVAEEAARTNTVSCPRCYGTGTYWMNGGKCFGCKGKGRQDATDRARNANYRLYQARLAQKLTSDTRQRERSEQKP